MSIIINEPWDYQLIKDADEYFLSVVCGSSGLYEVEFKLTQEEANEYEKNGKAGIEKMVSIVRNNPEKYMDSKFVK
jgi:hypothetical protein